jgi:hypothetical protein
MLSIISTQFSIGQVNPDIFLFGGVIGLFLGILFFLFFIYRRIRWIFTLFSKQRTISFKLLASLRNLILISLWTAVFGMILFLGFFLRSYYVFTLEKPVAEIMVEKTEQPNRSLVTLHQNVTPDSQVVQKFMINGDQWMLEGDIIKWDSWLNFVGIHTRYRLTRIRGRYLQIEEEVEKTPSIFSLTEKESIPLWEYFYEYGHHFPFVSTVYGNAAFQTAKENKKFLIYISTSGFVIREQKE